MARVLLLLPTTTYRTKAYIDAGLKLGVDVVAASEVASTMLSKSPDNILKLDLWDAERAAAQASEFARTHPVDAVIPVDEDTAVAAAWIARAIGLEHNSVLSTERARDKFLMREALRAGGLRVPAYAKISLGEDPAAIAARINFPCVVKPLFLSTSRGVMRANNAEELAASLKRLDALLALPKLAKRGRELSHQALIEDFIPGFEVAVEGLLTDGRLRVLTIFDKPDPLDGPFFEETIYVAPSRLSKEVQEQIAEATQMAASAMGLIRGPAHAELRINAEGPWIVEVAARAIGGLCSRTLRFSEGLTLEEIILMNAIGMNTSAYQLDPMASGVMMIPIPKAGNLSGVLGLGAAKAVADIQDVVITVHTTQKIVPPPEGASYLGFIFARAKTPDRVEAALRESHERLQFIIE